MIDQSFPYFTVSKRYGIPYDVVMAVVERIERAVSSATCLSERNGLAATAVGQQPSLTEGQRYAVYWAWRFEDERRRGSGL